MNKSQTINLFNVEKEYFVIDSNNLLETETHFYGYAVETNGIFDSTNLASFNPQELSGCGSYVYVEVVSGGGKINIYQDFNGSYGIYLYRNNNYFALSNSFLRLLDHVKHSHPLTLNLDFVNYFLAAGLCSETYSETAINEISLIDKDALITIDVKGKKLIFTDCNPKEKSILLSSPKAFEILDAWFLRWIRFFKELSLKTDQISVSLSGGFDSRLVFLLLLKSGIDLNKVRIRSIDDGLHTHVEDFQIASSISKQLGFKLNSHVLSTDCDYFSLEDILNIAFYTKLGAHKEMYFKYGKHKVPKFCVLGSGGEALRSYWNSILPKDFIQSNANRSRRFSKPLANEIEKAIKRVLINACQEVGRKHRIADPSSNRDLLSFLYTEGRNRNHFGKANVENYFAGVYSICPLMDPLIRKLQLSDEHCRDSNLLVTIAFSRYAPELLNFPFQGNRVIARETLSYSKTLNDLYPFALITEPIESVLDFNLPNYSARLSKVSGNIKIRWGDPDRFLVSVIESYSFRKFFSKFISKEFWVKAKAFTKSTNYFPLRYYYSVLAVAEIAKAVKNTSKLSYPRCGKSSRIFKNESLFKRLVGHFSLLGKMGLLSQNHILNSISDKFPRVKSPKIEEDPLE